MFTVDYPCLDNLRVYQEVIPCSHQWQKQLLVLLCLLMELGIPHVLLSLGPVYHEYCECPEEDPQAWQKTLSCPDKEPQIEKDFASFPSINLQQMLIEVPKRFGDERGAIVHYTILNNHIYRRSLGKYTDFKMFSDEILLSLTRKVWEWIRWFQNQNSLNIYLKPLILRIIMVKNENGFQAWKRISVYHLIMDQLDFFFL